MDANEFSFEALFTNSEFRIYESKEQLAAFKNLNDILEGYVADTAIRSKIEAAVIDGNREAQRDSFKQGFCFALKLFKFMLKI